MAHRRARRILPPTLLGLAIVVLSVGLRISDHPGLERVRNRLEWVAFDWRTRATLDRHVEKDPRVVIVDIDERSLREQGHWPWPRPKVAALLDRLGEAGAAVIGLDMVFAEPEANPAEQVAEGLEAMKAQGRKGLPGPQTETMLEQLRGLAEQLDGDRVLAESLAANPVMLGYVFTFSDASVGLLPRPLGEATQEIRALGLPELPHYSANLPLLQTNAAGGGYLTVEGGDEDGVIRRVPLLNVYGDGLYGLLALEVARLYLDMPPVELRIEQFYRDRALEAISLGGFIEIPTDSRGQVLVPYRGPQGSFPYVSATDVLAERVDRGVLDGAIALVGTSAKGLFDQRSTPVQNVFPGVEIHANVIAGILDDRFPYKPPWADGADVSLMVLLGLLLALIFPRLHALGLAVSSLVVTGLYVGVNTWVWAEEGLALTVAQPVLMVAILATLNMTYGFLAERRNRERLKGMFGQYVPADLVEEMNANPKGDYGFEGESREMTVLFCDIRGFTSISESLPANELKKMLNYFFTPMTRLIFENRGTIDKYVGDMIMAFWGAPLPDPDHRAHAIATAIAMLHKLQALQPELAERGWPGFHIGIGLNTGMMNVGDMGSSFRRAYTVIGDAVNLGSRLEGLTKYYGVSLIVSELTCQGQEAFVFRPLDRVRVKGKADPVVIFEPVCRRAEADEAALAELNQHAQALAAYYSRRWDEAELAFSQLIERHPERKLYLLYLERVLDLRAKSLPEDWDGVFTHTSK